MLKMNEDLEGALQAYLQLMDAQEYFEAHEALEEAWHPLRLRKDPLANLVKGLINGAVAFEHLKRARPQAADRARRVLASYERHKGCCTSDIAHAELFMQACEKIELLKVQYAALFERV